jgi:hypothetical protein
MTTLRATLVIAALLASATARADTSAGDKLARSAAAPPEAIVDHLAAYAHEGCLFLRDHLSYPVRRDWPHHRLATHFGRLRRAERTGGVYVEYTLAVKELPGWEVTYLEGRVSLKLPPGVVVTMAALAKRFGKPETEDVDYQIQPNFGENSTGDYESPKEWNENWTFPYSPEGKSCRITAMTLAHDHSDVDSQRVETFEFSN